MLGGWQCNGKPEAEFVGTAHRLNIDLLLIQR